MIVWGSATHGYRVSVRRKDRRSGRRQCMSGVCPNPCTHAGTANGVCLMIGCEFHVAMWARDPSSLLAARIRARKLMKHQSHRMNHRARAKGQIVLNESKEDKPDTLDQLERKHIARVLIATDCNLRKASSVLGIDRRTLYRKLANYGWMRDGNRVGLYKHLATLEQAEAR